MDGTVYERLGARRVLNAKGIYTDLGGAAVSPAVFAAMAEANEHAVDMGQLLDATGRRVAALLGVEAARVTPGASAAIALATAACMCGLDLGAAERLPDTAGLPSAVLVQRGHRTKYARMCRLAGAELLEVAPAELERMLDPRSVACVFAPGHLDGLAGTLPLAELFGLCRARRVPSLVDAAYLNYPPASMSRFCELGADLVCFRAKYFYGPSGGGLVCGREDLIEAVAAVDFTGFESGRYALFGRPFKLDRYTVVGTVLALEEWLALDHEARFAGYAAAVAELAAAVAALPGVEARPACFTMEETLEEDPVNCLVVRVADAAGVRRALADGEPAVACHLAGGELILAVDALRPGEEAAVARRLREALAGP